MNARNWRLPIDSLDFFLFIENVRKMRGSSFACVFPDTKKNTHRKFNAN